MARNVPDLAMLLSVQAGYDPRVPTSTLSDVSAFEHLDVDLKNKRIAWAADFKGYLPFEPGVLEVCTRALEVFESMGCIVEEAQPDYSMESVWRAFLTLRAWQVGASLLPYYNNPAHRALMKPEAIFEVESGLKLSAFDISAACAVRTEWYQAVRGFFERFDYFIVPTAQLFPFDLDLEWPKEIAGKKMQTYHEWMKCVLPITMSGCPALAVPAGFGSSGLPIGIQIAGPLHSEAACLQLAHGYDQVTRWCSRRLPSLLATLPGSH
jgi:amidase